MRRRGQLLDTADGIAQARTVEHLAQLFQAGQRFQQHFRRQRQRQEAVGHADQARRRRPVAMLGIDQCDTDGFRPQRADLTEQRGCIEVGQLRADDHRIHALRCHRGHRSVAIEGGQRLPFFPKIGNELAQLSRQAV